MTYQHIDSSGALVSDLPVSPPIIALPSIGGVINGALETPAYSSITWRFMRITLLSETSVWALNTGWSFYGSRYNDNNTTGGIAATGTAGAWRCPGFGSSKTQLELSLASNDGNNWFGLIRTSQEMYMGAMGKFQVSCNSWKFRHYGGHGSWRIEPYGLI